jgi:hypothetical protein
VDVTAADPTGPATPAAIGLAAPGSTLPCGTAVDALLDQVQAGRAEALTEHQRGCPHCRAVLAHYAPIFAPLRAMARETVRAPSSTVDDALLRLGAGGAAAPPWVVDAAGRGRTRVGKRVVLACARRAAEQVPGVRAALVRAASGEAGGAGLEVVLAATYGVDLRALGDRVRRAVADEVAARTGVVPASVSALVDLVVE